MPTTIGVEPVRRQLADLTHKILTERQGFIIERYGRPVAYLGPANIPVILAAVSRRINAVQETLASELSFELDELNSIYVEIKSINAILDSIAES